MSTQHSRDRCSAGFMGGQVNTANWKNIFLQYILFTDTVYNDSLLINHTTPKTSTNLERVENVPCSLQKMPKLAGSEVARGMRILNVFSRLDIYTIPLFLVEKRAVKTYVILFQQSVDKQPLSLKVLTVHYYLSAFYWGLHLGAGPRGRRLLLHTFLASPCTSVRRSRRQHSKSNNFITDSDKRRDIT